MFLWLAVSAGYIRNVAGWHTVVVAEGPAVSDHGGLDSQCLKVFKPLGRHFIYGVSEFSGCWW